MFIPCDHCLRKHATHVSEVNDRGEREHLRLCKGCYERLQQDLAHRPSPSELEEVERKMIAHEKAIAEGLQSNLLPHHVPKIPGYDVSAFYRPSREVGGDYYDFIEIDGDHLGILVADVSGKGIPGTIVMTETRALIKSEAVRTMSPAETLARVNRVLYHDIKRGMFVTVYYAILNRAKATLTCVSAGHNPMVLWRPSAISLVNPNGLALGIDSGALFERTLAEERIQLAAGDRFTFYSDGVIESMNRDHEPFGHNRFYLRVKQLGDRSSGEFLSALMSELDAHQGDAPQHDDITIVTGRYEGPA
jgi:sigma-B regulation protein RsbU (phosphoserine phosphatase)